MKAEEAVISDLKRALGALNTHLASNTFLVGHSVTLADIIMACNLCIGFKAIMTKSFTSEFSHVERYFWTLVNQPNFKKILGEVKQVESVPPVARKPSQPKESVKPKPKEEPKKEAKKEAKKEPAKPVEEEEEAPKPKPKNPLDLLPPSKMILDEWKRLYSNTKTNFREVAIKGTIFFYLPCLHSSPLLHVFVYFLKNIFVCSIHKNIFFSCTWSLTMQNCFEYKKIYHA